jgi:DNA-3-methyladenine glycosylase
MLGGIRGRQAEGVLIRALEPTQGLELMQRRRHGQSLPNLCNGPGKLVQAMGLGPSDNGANLSTPKLHLRPRRHFPAIMAGPRVGITKAADKPWRFFIANNHFVTKHKLNLHAVSFSA